MWISTSLMHDIECERRRELERMARSSTWPGLRRRRPVTYERVAPVPGSAASHLRSTGPAVAPAPALALPSSPATEVAERDRVVPLTTSTRRRPCVGPTPVDAPRGSAA
jgi:hypothetical protein